VTPNTVSLNEDDIIHELCSEKVNKQYRGSEVILGEHYKCNAADQHQC